MEATKILLGVALALATLSAVPVADGCGGPTDVCPLDLDWDCPALGRILEYHPVRFVTLCLS